MSDDKKTPKPASANRSGDGEADTAADDATERLVPPTIMPIDTLPITPYSPLSPGAVVEAGAAHSLASLFEGMVQNQLYASNIMAATTARCVNHILEGPARQRADTLEMFRET